MHRCAVEAFGGVDDDRSGRGVQIARSLKRSIRGEEKRRSTAGRLGFRRAGTASDDLDWPRSLAVHWV
jgi:hypothetical protein